MRDGLSREFPEAVRAATWTRASLGIWTEAPVWAAISGTGAGFLVSDVALVLVGLVNRALQSSQDPQTFTLFPLVTIAGSAAAAAVALGAGGPIALVLELAYVALGLALRIPGGMTFCERSGGTFPLPGPDQCSVLGFLTSLWPQLVGIGLGIAFPRAITRRGTGINSTLRIAGSLAVAVTVLSPVWGASVAQTASPLSSALTIAAGTAAAAVAVGVVAAQLPRGVRNAGIVAAIWMLPWLILQLPLSLQSLGPTVSDEFSGAIVTTLVISPVAAALMLLSAVVASRRRFIPREPA